MRETQLKAMMQTQNVDPRECAQGQDWHSMWVIDPVKMAAAERWLSFRLEPSKYIRMVPRGSVRHAFTAPHIPMP